ncbi:MAG: hypothetical protein WHS46_00245 [Desulfosoma sp.]
MKRRRLALFVLAGVFVLNGCADTGSSPGKASLAKNRLTFSEQAKHKEAWPDAQLRQAFTKYWEAALEGRFEECYQREADYVRQLVIQKKYGQFMEFTMDPKKVTAFEVGQPQAVSPYLYKIPLKAAVPTPTPGLPSPTRMDYWVKTDSGWYHAIKASLLFPELGVASALTGQSGSTPEGKEVGKTD